MRKLSTIMLTILLNLAYIPSFAKSWYSDGTLHSATLATWFNSSDENRMATAADIITVTVSEKNESKAMILVANDARLLKIKARQLVDCLGNFNQSAFSSSSVAEMSFVCLMDMGLL